MSGTPGDCLTLPLEAEVQDCAPAPPRQRASGGLRTRVNRQREQTLGGGAEEWLHPLMSRRGGRKRPAVLAAEPVVDLLPVVLQPRHVDSGPLQGLLHGQRRRAEASGAAMAPHKLLQLGKREKLQDRYRDGDGDERGPTVTPLAAPRLWRSARSSR